MASSPTAKNFLITGAGRGIGRGLSRLLLQQGHRVLLVDNNVEELDNTSARLKQHFTPDKDFQTVQCNLRRPSEIQSVVAAASTFFAGHLDVLINNAADTSGVGSTPFASLSLDTWTSSLETNLTAPMLLSQNCLPLLRKSSPGRPTGGCILHMSSTRARMSEPDNEAYAATKAGLLGLTQSMAVSLAGDGVRVHAILPGWIHVGDENRAADAANTPWEAGLSPADHAWHLTGRVGRVDDIFQAVLYLVGNEGATGSELVVDGGVTRKMVYPED